MRYPMNIPGRGFALVAAMLAMGAAALAHAASTPVVSPPPDASVYFISPAHGETVIGPVTVRFGLSGMGVAPAGIERAGTGHHHLLIDVDPLPPLDRTLPNDASHVHFGAGQTEAVLDLPSGEYTLQLVFADHDHVPHDPALVSEPIRIRVHAR